MLRSGRGTWRSIFQLKNQPRIFTCIPFQSYSKSNFKSEDNAALLFDMRVKTLTYENQEVMDYFKLEENMNEEQLLEKLDGVEKSSVQVNGFFHAIFRLFRTEAPQYKKLQLRRDLFNLNHTIKYWLDILNKSESTQQNENYKTLLVNFKSEYERWYTFMINSGYTHDIYRELIEHFWRTSHLSFMEFPVKYNNISFFQILKNNLQNVPTKEDYEQWLSEITDIETAIDVLNQTIELSYLIPFPLWEKALSLLAENPTHLKSWIKLIGKASSTIRSTFFDHQYFFLAFSESSELFVRACVITNSPDLLSSYENTMTSHKNYESDSSFLILLKGYVDLGRADDAQRLIQANKAHLTETQSLNYQLSALVNANQHAESLKLASEARATVSWDLQTFNTLLKLTTKTNDAELAEILYEQIANHGFTPDSETFNYMIRVYDNLNNQYLAKNYLDHASTFISFKLDSDLEQKYLDTPKPYFENLRTLPLVAPRVETSTIGEVNAPFKNAWQEKKRRIIASAKQ